MTKNRLIRLAGTLPIVMIMAACTSTGGATPVPSTAALPSAAPSAAAPSEAAPSGAASPSEAAAAESYPLAVGSGTVSGASVKFLTGEDGKTLYIFKKDTADSGKSVCNGNCASNWPPYAADDLDEVKADSAATGKLSIVTRDDGTKQLAYDGMPLYYFAADSAAGDTKGATIDNWTVANP
jgi:predicted lipoprotein with Yx(FWY)xxD motif